MDDLAKGALAWSGNMGPNDLDSASGVFFGAFALFAATTAPIMSGAVLERIRTSAFVILAVVLGSAVWIIGAAWGWHPAGWFITEWGLHDAGAAGCVHLIAGAFTLGVLLHLGPRIGRFASDGTPLTIKPHNLPLTMLGLMLIPSVSSASSWAASSTRATATSRSRARPRTSRRSPSTR